MKGLVFPSLLFLMLTSFVPHIPHQDTRNISGTVVGFDDSLPIEGVTVAVKGTHKATGTQVDGTFYLRLQSPQDSILIFSASGYQTQEQKVTTRNDYDVALKRSGN